MTEFKYANGRIAKAGDIIIGPYCGCYTTGVIHEINVTSIWIFTYGTDGSPRWPNSVIADHEQVAQWIHIDDLRAGMKNLTINL